MHIPDGFLTNPVCAATTAASIVGLVGAAVMARRAARLDIGAMAAVVGAGIFAGQMVNFPVAHGTSGHLLGATLATVLLGPGPAILTMAAVLAVQCCLFGDGGVFALGANVLNMALAGVLVTSVVLSIAIRAGVSRWMASATAAWCAVMTAAALCAIELAASGAQPLSAVLPAMLKVHAMIGLGEALITLAALAAIGDRTAMASRRSVVAGLGISLTVACLLAPFASASPDGLERVAETLGFADSSISSFAAPIGDYMLPGISSPPLATGLAGIVGAIVVFAVVDAIGSRRFAR